MPVLGYYYPSFFQKPRPAQREHQSIPVFQGVWWVSKDQTIFALKRS